MIKRTVVLIIMIAVCTFSISAKPVDVVVMLDTSESVLPIYDKLVNYIVKNVLTNHVRFGDTFHLISFDSKPELIYSRQLQNSEDLENVVADLFLLNPLGKHTDLIMALKYLNQYVSSLSDSGNSEIIILTDGIHDPPPGSHFSEIYETDKNTGDKINLLENELKSITRNGISVSLVKLPENGKIDTGSEINSETGTADSLSTDQKEKSDDAGSDAKAVSDSNNELPVINEKTDNNIFSFADNGSSKIYKTEFFSSLKNDDSATGSPRITYPVKMDKIKYHFKLPLDIENFYSKAILLKLDRVLFRGEDILDNDISIKLEERENKKISVDLKLPRTVEPGEFDLSIKLIFNDQNRAYPDTAVIHVYLKKSVSDFLKDINIVFKIIFLVLIAAVLVVFFFIFFSSFVHVSVRDSYNVIKKDFEEILSDKALRPLALRVIGQNDSRIGRRNIHSFNDKSVKTLGGGHSSYLIFLYKIPSHIAEIAHRDGKYWISVREKDFFPDMEEDSSEIVFERNIRIRTENNTYVECYFYEYISPLEKINTIMKLTEHKGMPENRISIYSR